MNISAIHKLAPEKLIAVKAKVVSISGVKSLKTLYGTLMKQDVNVADTTAHIKLVLWEQFVNTLALNNTYNIKNARVKVANYERYLNSPRNDDFSTAKAVDCATQVVQYQEDLGTTIHATILGDQTATKLWLVSTAKGTMLALLVHLRLYVNHTRAFNCTFKLSSQLDLTHSIEAKPFNKECQSPAPLRTFYRFLIQALTSQMPQMMSSSLLFSKSRQKLSKSRITV